MDLTVLAIPAYAAAIGAEVAWQRAHPVEPGTRAGDYQTADTLASLAMGAGSLVAPYLSRKLLDPVTPGRGRYGRALLTIGAVAAVLTTVGDVARRRVRDGRLPDPQTVPDEVREVQEELAGLRQGPAVPREDRAPARPSLERVHGGLAAAAVAGTALTVSTLWAARTGAEPVLPDEPARPRRRPGRLGGRRPRLGLHLLLEPPPQPRVALAVGRARRPPLERALQPVDGPAAAGRGVDHDRGAVRPARPARRPAGAHRAGARAQPDLPVLDPHRGDPGASARSRRC